MTDTTKLEEIDNWGVADFDGILKDTLDKIEQSEEAEEFDDAEEELEEDEALDQDAEEEDPEIEAQPEKKDRSATGRIKDLSKKLKEKDKDLEERDRKLQDLELKFDNLQQGIDYINKPKEEVKVISLDERLHQAALAAGDREFDIDEFTTDAEKKTALLGYENKITYTKVQADQEIASVKQQYQYQVEAWNQQDPTISTALVSAYNAAVLDESRAIMRKYPNLTSKDAIAHAEKALLTEARAQHDPVLYIATFGKQILDDAKQLLTEPKEKVKIDHKNRKAVQDMAGKPEIETAPVTKRAQEVNKRHAEIASEW